MPSRFDSASRCAWLLVCRDYAQIGIVEPRLRQHRAGDRDVVVLGERAHRLRRRVRHRRDASRKFRQRLGFDLLDQAADDVVEQRHMFGRELVGALEK